MRNLAVLLGFVGQEPSIKKFDNGNEVASFSLATSESWKDKKTGERKSRSEWHKIIFHGNLVNVIKNYVHKGSKLYVEGSIKYRKYTNNEGVEVYITEIIGKTLTMLDSKNSNQSSPNENSSIAEQVRQEFNGSDSDGFGDNW